MSETEMSVSDIRFNIECGLLFNFSYNKAEVINMKSGDKQAILDNIYYIAEFR